MTKELLYKYFRAETSPKENEQILTWIDESEENQQLFLAERKLWNIAILQGDISQSEKQPSRKIHIRPIIKYAAAVAAILIVSAIGIQLYNYSPVPNEQTVFVPTGQRVNLTLADGTSVWLNSNTHFAYSTDFNKNTREVNLNGEAYFEVAHNSKRPFVVHTEKSDVKVLGTKFNVLDYVGSGLFETSVKEGSVKVIAGTEEPIVLKSSEKAVLKDNKLQKLEGVDTESFSWQNGVLVFNDEPIENVMEMLGAYYNKDIRLEYEFGGGYRCTAKFLYNDGLDYILKIIQKDLHYNIQKDNATNTIILN